MAKDPKTGGGGQSDPAHKPPARDQAPMEKRSSVEDTLPPEVSDSLPPSRPPKRPTDDGGSG